MRKFLRTLRRRLAPHGGRAALLNRLPTGATGAEIGVFKGDFSEHILQTIRPRKFHLIDPWRYEPSPEYGDSWYGGEKVDQAFMEGVRARFAPQIEAGTVILHRSPSEEAAADFPDEYFDWVYIDGNHFYEFVKADLANFLPKVKSGGYLAGDDYQEGGWWNGGVKRAVDEIVASGVVELVLVRNAQFLLRKP